MYTEHAKFQKASFNSNWDVKQWNKMFWIDTFISPNTFLCYNFSFGSIPSPHQVHSIAFLQQHLVGEVKVLIQNFLFHRVLHVGEGWRSRQVFHLERAGGQCFTNISCFSLKHNINGWSTIQSLPDNIVLCVLFSHVRLCR